MYINNGWWYTYSLSTGQLLSTGRLSDIWGSSGTNAPAVSVSGKTVFPFVAGKKTTGIWGQGLISALFGKQGKWIIFNDGAYWTWDNSSGKATWIASGLTSDLMSGSTAFRGITPTSNGGPSLVVAFSNANKLMVINDGIAWLKTGSGWSQPKEVSDILRGSAFTASPGNPGGTPDRPVSGVVFENGVYLNRSTSFPPTIGGVKKGQEFAPVPSDTQLLLMQDGKNWLYFVNESLL